MKENETNNTMYKYSGYAIFSFDVDTEPGIIDIEGGSLTGEIRDVVPVTVHNYYSGFELGELGMSSALGIPVEQNNRGDSQFMKSVVLPTQTENSYLWSGASSVWEMQTRFQEKYEVKLEFDSSAEGAYTPNVKLWYFDHGSYPERFYYGADKLGTPASVLPARCTVKIHCKDDPDSSNWPVWFVFNNIIPYEYNYKLSSTSSSNSWTGDISFSQFAKCISIERHVPTVEYDQPSALVDIDPRVGVLLEFNSGNNISAPGGGTLTCKRNLGALSSTVNLSVQSLSAPIYTDVISGPSVSSGGYSFPNNFDGWYLQYNAPAASLRVAAPVPIIETTFDGVDYYVLPSAYLTHFYHSFVDLEYGKNPTPYPYYPGLILRKHPADKWDNTSYPAASKQLSFVYPTKRINAGGLAKLNYATNYDPLEYSFSVSPAEYFSIESVDKINKTVTVRCAETTQLGTTAEIRAYGENGVMATHTIKSTDDGYILKFYYAFDYVMDVPFFLRYKREAAGYYAVQMETKKTSTDIPVFSSDGMGNITLPDGTQRNIEDVIASIEVTYPFKPSSYKTSVLLPVKANSKGLYYYHNATACNAGASSASTYNKAIDESNGYYGRFTSFSVSDGQNLPSNPGATLQPVTFTFTEEFKSLTDSYPVKVQIMPAAEYDYK